MKPIATTLTALALVAAGGTALEAGSGDGYRAVLEPYEAVRQALVADDLETARQGAGRLQDQPDGETTGNPYYGREMPTCGELVSR